jgi:hydrogenase nickel incorporation protein HypA/HybF
MHELAITQSILDIALEHAQREGVTRIARINLVIGAMTGVVEEYVRLYMRLINVGTAAEGAEIAVRSVPITVRCRECAEISEIRDSRWVCPLCESTKLEFIGGEELLVESIEVDDTGEGSRRPTS